jgi:hypothetical protein
MNFGQKFATIPVGTGSGNCPESTSPLVLVAFVSMDAENRLCLVNVLVSC